MGKKRKNKNIKELPGSAGYGGVNFDLEEDADELFSSYLDSMDPHEVLSQKETKEPAKQTKKISPNLWS